MSSEIVTVKPAESIFSDMAIFEDAQRSCKVLASSDLVPKAYKGNIANCLVALEMANRIGASPLMVMQNLHIIQGRPSFGSAFLVATINTCGRFSPIQYDIKPLGKKTIKYAVWTGDKDNRKKMEKSVDIVDMECIAYAKDIRSGEILKGPKVTIEMAVLEGWYTKADSKWLTMPDLMIRYRAAAFFVRTYAPELSMGMKTSEEWIDADVVDITDGAPVISRAQSAQKLNVDDVVQDSTPKDVEYTETEDIVPENESMPDGSDSDNDNNDSDDLI